MPVYEASDDLSSLMSPDGTMAANSDALVATQRASRTATFYLTDDGTSSGAAVFTNVYADSITISPYGTSAVYQISSPVVAGDRKSITANVNQVTSVLLGLIQSTTVANGVQCNLLVLGD